MLAPRQGQTKLDIRQQIKKPPVGSHLDRKLINKNARTVANVEASLNKKATSINH